MEHGPKVKLGRVMEDGVSLAVAEAEQELELAADVLVRLLLDVVGGGDGRRLVDVGEGQVFQRPRQVRQQHLDEHVQLGQHRPVLHEVRLASLRLEHRLFHQLQALDHLRRIKKVPKAAFNSLERMKLGKPKPVDLGLEEVRQLADGAVVFDELDAPLVAAVLVVVAAQRGHVVAGLHQQTAHAVDAQVVQQVLEDAHRFGRQVQAQHGRVAVAHHAQRAHVPRADALCWSSTTNQTPKQKKNAARPFVPRPFLS